MTRAGRPTKLTPEVCNKICEELRGGCSLLGAAEASGISEATFYNWKKRGEAAASGKYLEFLKEIKKADAQGQVTLVNEVRNAARKGQWQAAAWLLERKWPDLWGKRERLDVTKHEESDIGSIIIADKELSRLWTQTLKHVKRERDAAKSDRSSDND